MVISLAKSRSSRRRSRRDGSILVHSDAALERQRYEDSLPKPKMVYSAFERGFGPVLSGNQMGACMRLRKAHDIVEIAGNAKMGYEGQGIDNLSYGSKTIAERVLFARGYLRQCEREVVSRVQMKHHDGWRVLQDAIIYDLPPQAVGDRYRNWMGRDKRRACAVDVVLDASTAILNVRLELGG